MEAQGLQPVEYVHALKYSGCADVYRAGMAPEEIETVLSRAQTHLGQKYDYFLIGLEFFREETGIQLPYDETAHHDLICSMLIADAFRPEYDPCPGIEYPTPGDEAKSGLWSYAFSY